MLTLRIPGQVPAIGGNYSSHPPSPPDAAPTPSRTTAGTAKSYRTPIPPRVDTQSIFRSLTDALVEEHDRMVSALEIENGLLRDRLNLVISSTWGLNPGVGGSMVGSPPGVGFESLQLMGTQWTHAVTKDELAKFQLEKPSAFQARSFWWSEDSKTESFHEGTNMDNTFTADVHRSERLSDGLMSKFIISPASNGRLAWDISGMILLLWDMIMIPIGLFGLADTPFLKFMDWLTLVFWTFDMGASVLTGFMREGVYIMDRASIFKNYLKTWFLVDVVVLGPDWTMTFMNMAGVPLGGGSAKNLTGMLRAPRVLRVLRLLRLTKFVVMLRKVKDHIENEYWFIVVAAVQMLITIVFINHFMGAAFYFIGQLHVDANEISWISISGIMDQPLFYRYLTALQWSFACFSLGASSVQPQTTGEIAFAIFTIIVGMVSFCAFTANATNWVQQVREMIGEDAKQVWLLRRYLRQNGVRYDLHYRIQRFIDDKLDRDRKSIPRHKLTILNYLTGPLAQELEYLVTYLPVSSHPLFEFAESVSSSLVYSLVKDVLSQCEYAQGDVVFRRGGHVPHMVICAKGTLHYRKQTPDLTTERMVTAGYWACEPTLWVPWACRGDLRANTDSEVHLLDTQLFAAWAKSEESMLAVMVAYAEHFLKWLNKVDPADLTDISIAATNRELISDTKKTLRST